MRAVEEDLRNDQLYKIVTDTVLELSKIWEHPVAVLPSKENCDWVDIIDYRMPWLDLSSFPDLLWYDLPSLNDNGHPIQAHYFRTVEDATAGLSPWQGDKSVLRKTGVYVNAVADIAQSLAAREDNEEFMRFYRYTNKFFYVFVNEVLENAQGQGRALLVAPQTDFSQCRDDFKVEYLDSSKRAGTPADEKLKISDLLWTRLRRVFHGGLTSQPSDLQANEMGRDFWQKVGRPAVRFEERGPAFDLNDESSVKELETKIAEGEPLWQAYAAILLARRARVGDEASLGILTEVERRCCGFARPYLEAASHGIEPGAPVARILDAALNSGLSARVRWFAANILADWIMDDPADAQRRYQSLKKSVIEIAEEHGELRPRLIAQRIHSLLGASPFVQGSFSE